jgi:hypothetical protein
LTALPNFMCIGAQRAGTTWLYENLKVHEQIWLPPIKELHYFDQLRVQPFWCKRYKGQLWRRLQANRISLRRGQWSPRDFLWDLKYFAWPKSDRWYRSLFSQGRKRVAGEFTPDYSILPAETIADVRRINPDLKIILLMRDPIDRAWSQARKDLPRVFKRPLHQIPADEVIRWFNSRYCAPRSDYARILDNWYAHFPRAQFFCGFFEEIIADPQDLLLRIHQFLGVEKSTRHVSGTAGEAVNAMSSADLPPAYEHELARIHEPKLVRLKEMLHPYPTRWHRRCLEILNSSGARTTG